MHRLFRAQFEAAAQSLPGEIFDYLDGGSGDEVSRNEAQYAWQQWRLLPRVLRDVSTVDTGVELLGVGLRAPVLVAPTASHGLVHPEGEVATARGVRAAGSLLTLSTRSSALIEDVAAAADGPWWFQVYLTRERAACEGAVRRAATCGAGALVLTGDTPYVGRKARAGRPAPLSSDLAQRNLGQHLPAGADPGWALEQDPAATVADIERLAQLSGLPVLVKGVLRADEAQRCVDAGAAGVIVSNHGGRQLDRALASALALSAVVDAVGGQVPVLVDGGIRSGTDVLTALALGASAVLLGRPVLWALHANGADGVTELLTTLGDDFAHCLALAGSSSTADVDRSLITRADRMPPR